MTRIVCVGAGPAGLYFSIVMKLSHGDTTVAVLERRPAGATYGWGVVFWDDFLFSLHRSDPRTAQAVRDEAHVWRGQEVWLPGERVVYLGGHGYSISRARLLEILTSRAMELGVDVRFECPVTGPELLQGADLVVAADGVNSAIRESRHQAFGTSAILGRNKYIWLGTDKVFKAFTFAFEQTRAGPLWFHAYPSAQDISTLIAECPPQTWEGLGFAGLTQDESATLLKQIFATHLHDHRLLFQATELATKSSWLNFRQICNERWYDGDTVLIGDAAHTTHFSVGAGTLLAVEDAIELGCCLSSQRDELEAAVTEFDRRRRLELRTRQAAALRSMEWFERLEIPSDREAVEFGFELWTRRDDHAVWRRALHYLTQYRAIRRVRSRFASARRSVRFHHWFSDNAVR